MFRVQLTSQLLLAGLRQQEGHAVHQGGPNLRAVPPPLGLHLPTVSSCDCTHSTAFSADQCCASDTQLHDAMAKPECGCGLSVNSLSHGHFAT